MAVEKERFAGTDKKFFVVEKAGGINTQAQREAIRDDQFSWIENLQPISDGNFRALYSNAGALYTAPGGKTIVYHFPFNIGATNYIFVVLSDGTAVAVNSDTAAVTTITSTVGAFFGPTVATLPQAVQYGQQYLVIVSKATDPYSIWDGTTFYTRGTLAPSIVITNGGAAYQSAPTVVFHGGAGSGAAATATINKGSVVNINITNPGSGYLLGDTPTITLVGGTLTGSGASLTAVLSAISSGSGGVLTPTFSQNAPNYAALVSIAITSGGTGYSAFTTASWAFTSGAWYLDLPPSINLTISGGVITAVTFTPQGGNPVPAFFNAGNSAINPTIVVTDNGGGFTVTSVTVTSGGTNYSPSTVITATGGGSPVYQAQISPVIVAGVITTSIIENGGQYGSNTPPTLTVSDTAITATATVALMPFGMSGTCVEVYQSRVWVGNIATVSFTAPSSVWDFTVGDGAGAFSSSDSFLRQQFTNLKTLGSFLYLFADSSINVISNVQASGMPVVTTFNNQNVDPQYGTPWFNSVGRFGGKLVFANTIGVFTTEGSYVQKVSDDLDGIFATANATLKAQAITAQPTCAFMTLNEIPTYMLVVPVQGPLDGGLRTALVMWDGKKWWVGSQVLTMTQVATQEINSVLTAWGNTGTTINKMFNGASGSLTKLWQPKLWSGEGAHIVKQAMRLYSMGIDKTSGGWTFTGTVDYRLEGTAILTQALSITDISLTGSGSISANARGNYLGFTLHTTKDDFVLIGQGLLYQEQSPMP